MKQSDKNDSNYDRHWKMRILFYQRSDAYAKLYNPLNIYLGMKLLCFSKGEIFSNSIFQRDRNTFM